MQAIQDLPAGEALGIERIGVTDGFFDLGGNSLSAVQIFFKVREHFGVQMPLRTLFEAQTIQEFARRLEDKMLEEGDANDLDQLLGEIEELSEDEAETLLRQVAVSATNGSPGNGND